MRLQSSIINFLLLLYVNNIEARWKPNQYMSWNIALGSEVDISNEPAEILEIDLEKGKSLIEKYHSLGKKVICYFSGGTIEDYRDDYKQYAAVDGLVRNVYSAWPDERWLDYRVSGIKPLIKARMEMAVQNKCDAIDVDNVDGYQIDDVKNWSNPLTKEDAITFTKWLGETAHSYGLSIGLKNCLDIVDTVGGYYDFAVNEGCVRRNECHWYKNFLATGKPVLGITYNGLSANREALCKNLNGLPISMIIKESTKLVQSSVVFDGKKHCGSNFSSGRVSLPDASSSSDSSSSSGSSGSSGNSGSSGSSSNSGSSGSSSNSGSSGSSGNSGSSGSSSNSSNSGNSGSSGKSGSSGSSDSSSNKNKSSSESKKDNSKSNSNDKSADIEESITNGNSTLSDSTSSKKGTKNDSSNDNELNDNLENDESHTGLVTGVAVTGSVAGAAALIVFKKKNPRQYEQLKRNISRRASTVKHSASTVTRKLTSKTRKTRAVVGNPYTDFHFDLNNNPYSTYRYSFTKSLR